MTAYLAPQFDTQFFDGSTVAAGYKLYTYDSGTTTPKAVYSDQAGTVPHTNPIVLDANGRVTGQMFLGSGEYTFTLKTDSDVLVKTWNDVAGSGTANEAAAYDAAIRSDLASTSDASKGAGMVGVFDAQGNYSSGDVDAVLAEIATMFYGTRYSVEDAKYGASSGGTATANTTAIQACINAAPEGAVIYFPSRYQINDELVVNKSLTFMGPYSGPVYVRTSYAGIVQTNSAKACFKLVATQTMYAFGSYGIVGMRFIGLSGEGPSNASKALAFIRCDTSINGGDFHVRENLFERLSLRWFTNGLDLTGITYLNLFNYNSITYCDIPVKIARGGASDNGGQNRFIGGFYGLSRVGLSLYEDGSSGSAGLHGVSVSENTEYGIRVHEETLFYTSPDCEFESNTLAGIYIEIKEANPNTTGPKTLGGKFLTNGADIYINKTSSSFSGGGFHFPCKIDNAYLGSAIGLKVDVPLGHAPIDSQAFILGKNITGPTGPVDESQISTNFAGTDDRKGSYSKRIVVPTSYVSGTVIAYLPKGLVVTTMRCYFTANSSGFTSISLGDQANGSRYLTGINGQTVTLNTWQTATITPPQVELDGTNNAIRFAGTAGWLSAAAVVEIDGYLT